MAPGNSYFPAPAYKISKAAANALTAQYAVEYEKEGFSFTALCPGVCSLPLAPYPYSAIIRFSPNIVSV